MFERLTQRARDVVTIAQEEARALGHEEIGTEHLLLGLVGDCESVAAGMLLELGADPQRVRSEVLSRLSRPVIHPGGARTAAAHPRWEYRLERPDASDGLTDEWLDALGGEGWELVGFAPDARLVFRRRPRAG